MGKRVTQKSKDEFAALLKRWRASLGLSQSKAAKVLGIESVRTLHNWEVARTSPQGSLRTILANQLTAQLPAPVRKKTRR